MIDGMTDIEERSLEERRSADASREPRDAPAEGGPAFELGLYSFGERTADPETGKLISFGERTRHLLEEIELADQVGLDVYGVGEHHRPDFIVSSPAVVLAAAAARTEKIRLTSAVTVLSSDDPVRVFQDFATVDLLSNGRAEIMAGRGSFVESFPLFGYDLGDYDALFEEKLELLLELRARERVTWSGDLRASLDDQGVYPRPEQNPLPVWIAVGGTPASVVRAARLGLPLAVAIIGGAPEQFAPLVQHYRNALQREGRDPAAFPVSINSHGFLAEDERDAADTYWPPYLAAMSKIGRERGWAPMRREQYDALRTKRGALFVGEPEQVIEKILFQHDIFRHDRFLLQLGVGSLPHAKVLKAIELYGTEVAPVVRKEIAARNAG